MKKYFDSMGNIKTKLTDSDYIAIMERVAETNNPIWNKYRKEEGLRPLSVDEDLLRILNDNTYNYRGYYEKYPNSRANADTHWPDEFKTVYHPTFSNESIYSGKKSQYNPQGLVGGTWVGKDGEEFVPAPWQTDNKYRNGGRIKAEDGEIYDEPYFGGYLNGITVTPSGNRNTTRDDWYNADYQQKVEEKKRNERQQMYDFQDNIRKSTASVAPYATAALFAPYIISNAGVINKFLQHPVTSIFGKSQAAGLADIGIQEAEAMGAMYDLARNLKNKKYKPADTIGETLKNYSNIGLDLLASYPFLRTTNTLRKNLKYTSPNKSYAARTLIDVISNPAETAKALYKGEYIRNKSDLLRMMRKANKEAIDGANFTRDFYRYHTDVLTTEPKINFYHPYEYPGSLGYYNANKRDILHINPYRYPNSNIIDAARVKGTAAHENTHRTEGIISKRLGRISDGVIDAGKEHFLDYDYVDDLNIVTNYTVPTQYFDAIARYFRPHREHPIIRKYLKYFNKGNSHGRSPEEHIADFVENMSYGRNWHDTKQDILLSEGTSLPAKFYEDYFKYLRNSVEDVYKIKNKYNIK